MATSVGGLREREESAAGHQRPSGRVAQKHCTASHVPQIPDQAARGANIVGQVPWSFRQELLLHSVEWPDHRVMEGRNAPLAFVLGEDTQAELLLRGKRLAVRRNETALIGDVNDHEI